MIDEALLAYAVGHPARLLELQRAGISVEHFVDEYRTVWKYIMRSKRDHDTVPSPDVLMERFPELRLPDVKRRDLPLLVSQIRQRRKFIEFLTALNEVAASANHFDQVDEAIQALQGKLNAISSIGGKQGHLVDLFSPKVRDRMVEELQRRRSGAGSAGIPTGLPSLDTIAGGLQRQRMVTIIGRPGVQKSWLDLYFVAKAVITGHKVILYPLEMSLAETAFRLYTLFTQQCFGEARVLKNYDLLTGSLSPRRVMKFLMALEDKFKGQLYVADVASLSDPYTNERIEAEVEMYKPDMFWVDYLTLLKPPPSARNGGEDWNAVRQLSNGIKNVAMRRECVGGASAQVNREAMRTKVFLPRLEHIAYGDSIGQDADQVISINRKGEYLYYALVKNRGGPEIGRKRVRFNVNEGELTEVPQDSGRGEEGT